MALTLSIFGKTTCARGLGSNVTNSIWHLYFNIVSEPLKQSDCSVVLWTDYSTDRTEGWYFSKATNSKCMYFR